MLPSCVPSRKAAFRKSGLTVVPRKFKAVASSSSFHHQARGTLAMAHGDAATTADSDHQRFPDGFMWGAATSSYQIEGAWEAGGKGLSIWDAFSHSEGRISDGGNGDVACDHYNRWREDIRILKELGLKYYRFSISWPRLLPDGQGTVNEEGVKFYNDLIDGLLELGIEPMVTLYHWDLPMALEQRHGGWLGGEAIVTAFAEYSDLCFSRFGDRVKWWITINEPWVISFLGYATGEHAPGRRKAPGTEPYEAGHNLLLAHAAAVQRYREKHQKLQQGRVGLSLNSDWMEPAPAGDDASAEAANWAASKRGLDFMLGWFAHPIFCGDYPVVMRQVVGDRLPQFTPQQRQQLLGSADFLGLNHYCTNYARPQPETQQAGGDSHYWKDWGVDFSQDPSWDKTDMGWAIVPFGLRKLLLHIQEEYNPAGGVVITENGMAAPEPTHASAEHDSARQRYLHDYLAQLHLAMQQGADCRGYFAWSLLDNFEWAFGYSKRFGLVRVDYDTQQRTIKGAGHWYASVVAANALQPLRL